MKTKLIKYRKQSLDTGINASKEVVHKTGEFLENKKADAVAKLHDNKIVKADEKTTNVEKKTIPLEKREEILNELRQVLQKWNTTKYLNY